MTLAFVLLGLIIVTALYLMYLSWKISEGAVFAPVEATPFVKRWTMVVRLIRRGWYGVRLETKQAVTWTGKQAEDVLVTVFPSSAPAFKKPDELTGLTEGPSSYFLKSISPETKSAPKRLPRSKKVV